MYYITAVKLTYVRFIHYWYKSQFFLLILYVCTVQTKKTTHMHVECPLRRVDSVLSASLLWCADLLCLEDSDIFPSAYIFQS